MITLTRNLDLAPKIQGWETAAACGFDVAFLTANYTAAISLDTGRTFTQINPDDLLNPLGLKLCCDQGVTYVPSINTFVWILLSEEGPIAMAVSRPDQLQDSKGLSWTVYLIRSTAFNLEDDRFDYPDVCFGNNFLYLTANLIKKRGALMVRMPLADIDARGAINSRFVYVADEWYLCPVQLTGAEGWFGTMYDLSTLRLYRWPESALSPQPPIDVVIATVPDELWHSITPDSDDWLPDNSKIGTMVTGAARAGQELWFAWSAGRRVSTNKEIKFMQPHIELAVVSTQSRGLIRQEYIWNADFAFAWPSLASNPAKQVAMSFSYGGGPCYPQHAVGLLSPRHDFVTTTDGGPSIGAGGHYVRVRLAYPNSDAFVAGGYFNPKRKGGATSHPQYVVFRG
jgi:hypothetical protein